jgi:hypothetical protein
MKINAGGVAIRAAMTGIRLSYPTAGHNGTSKSQVGFSAATVYSRRSSVLAAR